MSLNDDLERTVGTPCHSMSVGVWWTRVNRLGDNSWAMGGEAKIDIAAPATMIFNEVDGNFVEHESKIECPEAFQIRT